MKGVALLVIKVKPGIRVKETPKKSPIEVEPVAINEMAVKINEWKSSLSSSSLLARTTGRAYLREHAPQFCVGRSDNENEIQVNSESHL